MLPGAAPAPQGSLVASGYLGVSNTGLRAALPRQLLLTPGEQVRSHSNYNEVMTPSWRRTRRKGEPAAGLAPCA